MAQQVTAESQNPLVIAVADASVNSQTAEVTEMQPALGE
jgi:uncharacterized protein (DUF305 family)